MRVFHKSPNALRKWCERCGAHLFTEVPDWKMAGVYAAMIPSLPFRPTLHIHCPDAVLQVRDGLPKLKDLPAELGGSGVLLPEP